MNWTVRVICSWSHSTVKHKWADRLGDSRSVIKDRSSPQVIGNVPCSSLLRTQGPLLGLWQFDFLFCAYSKCFKGVSYPTGNREGWRGEGLHKPENEALPTCE